MLALSSAPLAAQTLYLYPTAAVAPRGTYQTVTAVVTGVNDKTVTWTSNGGAIYGTNPCVTNEPCTAALYSATAGTYTLTATSNANGAVVASSAVTFTASPTPANDHPRLMITSAMLPGLRAKAVSSNVAYMAFKNYAIHFYNQDNAIFSWTCNGGSGLPSSNRLNALGYGALFLEWDAYYYAFLAMVDPSDPTYNWGCYAHDTWVYMMNGVVSGGLTPAAMGGNRWSDDSPALSLTTDWMLASGLLSSSEQVLARSYLAKMIQGILPGYGALAPVASAYNSPAEYNPGGGATSDLYSMRMMGNNYTQSKYLFLVAASLTFNDNTTDDPAMTNTCSATRYQMCSDYTAGSLHAYWNYFAGGMLYLEYAHLEDPNVSWKAYLNAFGTPTAQPTCKFTDGSSHPCFGDGRGGESSEGSWYFYSIYRLRYALNAAYTAGYLDPLVWGPQMSLSSSSWWDMHYLAQMEFLTGFSPNNGPSTGNPAYSFWTTGDTNTYYRTPDDFWALSAIMVFDSYTGRTDRTNSLLWALENVAFGGPLGTSGGCTSYCGFDNDLTSIGSGQNIALDLFLATAGGDPVSPLPTDPRGSFPLDLYNGSFNQHLILRSGWTSSSTAFSYYAPNALINHEHQTAGLFDIFSNNEYITKRQVGFNNYNNQMQNAPAANELSVIPVNSSSTFCATLACQGYLTALSGGQFNNATQAGLTTLYHSELPSYAAMILDNTKDYDGVWSYYVSGYAWNFGDVTHASRSLVYLRGSNQVIYYDRGITQSASAKATYLNSTGALTVSGSTASWLTRSGTQKAYLTSLLPAGANVNAQPLFRSLSVSAPSGSIQAGSNEQFSCLLNNGNGATTDMTSTVSWSSTNTAVATISSAGLATGVGVGTTVVSAFSCEASFGCVQQQGTLTVTSASSPTAWGGSVDSNQISDWEPYATVQVEASGTPTTANFLTALEWGPSTLSKSSTVLVQSTSGTSFDGALIGSSLAMFKRNWTDSAASVTWPASGATTQYVADLIPNHLYNLTGAGVPSSVTTDTAGVLTFAATGSGNITVADSGDFVLSTSVTGSGSISGCAGSYSSGASYSCAATPRSGFALSSWSSTCGGTASGTTYSGIMPSANCAVSATFTFVHPVATSTWQGITFQGVSIH